MVMNKGKEKFTIQIYPRHSHGLVRLRAHSIREVKVLFRCTLQPVADCNCVAVKRGGEQQEANDQSVERRTRFGRVFPASLRANSEAQTHVQSKTKRY
jgi:hypothetical protein